MYSNPIGEAKGELAGILTSSIKFSLKNVKIRKDDLNNSINVSNGALGDLSSSIAFRLAKELKKNPHEIALQIVKGAKSGKIIAELSELNGYVNAKFDKKYYSKMVLDATSGQKEKFGTSGIGKKEKVIVEFPSVNPNKPWHVGHLRNALLGDSISNLMSFCSYDVEREDYINDLGLQMAESLWGWMHLSNKPAGKVDQWFGEQYVKVNKIMAEKPEIKEEINSLLKKMEDINSTEFKTMRGQIATKSIHAQYETAYSYGIFHNVMIWESDIVRVDLFKKGIELASGMLERPKEGKYAGATVVKLDKITKFAKELEGSREDAKVIVRSSGVATYVGKDFAFHTWKFGLLENEFKYEKFAQQPNGEPVYSTSDSGESIDFGGVKKAINIIDTSQSYEQTVMRIMFSIIGREDIASNLIHLAYGKVRLEEGDLGTRKGDWLGEEKSYTADELLKEVKAKAQEIVSSSEKVTDKRAIDSISTSVALAAIKFEYLKIAPEKEIVFSWKKALSFEGNSGPYCLYTYARATRVLEKNKLEAEKPSDNDFAQVSEGYDFQLLKLIGSFPEVVEKACKEYRPNIITDYLLDLCTMFSKFYESMPILKGEDAKNLRLNITVATKQTIKNGLMLLGISAIERM